MEQSFHRKKGITPTKIPVTELFWLEEESPTESTEVTPSIIPDADKGSEDKRVSKEDPLNEP